MSDDLDRALQDYAQRQTDRESGLPDDEQRRLRQERADRAAAETLAAKTVEWFAVIDRGIRQINSTSQNRIPQLTSRSSAQSGGTNAPSYQTMASYSFEPTGNLASSEAIQFELAKFGGLSVFLIGPVPGDTSMPTRKLLGGTVDPNVEWVRSMVAHFLDQKQS